MLSCPSRRSRRRQRRLRHGRWAAASTTSGNVAPRSRPRREWMRTSPSSSRLSRMRQPSYLSSKIQPGRVNAFSVVSASIGPRLAARTGAAWCSGLFRHRRELRVAAHTVAQLVDREPGQHRAGKRDDRLRRRRPDRRASGRGATPCLRRASCAPAPSARASLCAAQLDVELAARQALRRRYAVEGVVDAAIPQDHRAGAVVSGRDDALEAAVLHRVIFGLDGEALLLRIDRRSARHGPAHQHAVDLQTKVPMQAPRRVLLDDEGVGQPGLRRSGHPRDAERLGRARRIALFAIGIERASAHGR